MVFKHFGSQGENSGCYKEKGFKRLGESTLTERSLNEECMYSPRTEYPESIHATSYENRCAGNKAR